MSKDGYNIDDILLEAQRLKEKAEQGDYPKKEHKRGFSDQKIEDAINMANDIRESAEYSLSALEQQMKANKIDDFSLEIDSLSVDAIKAGQARPELSKQRTIKAKTTGNRSSEPHLPTKEQSVPPLANERTSKKKKKKNEEMVSLFNFQPEKREKPIQNGPFGQKYFNFNQQRQAAEIQPEIAEPSIEFVEENDNFDFDSISDKIGERQETSNMQIVSEIQAESENPFETEFGVAGNNKIEHKYSKLVFGKNQEKLVTGDTGSINAEIDSKKGEGRKSIFSTFATGTGRELKIEDIKKIDFSALEGAGGYYDDEDEEDNFTEEIPEKNYIGFNEYLPKSNRRDVVRDIGNTKLSLFIRTAIVGLITIILFYITFSAKNMALSLPLFMHPDGKSLFAFILVPTILTALLLVICANTTISGVASLFKMRANSDTLVSFALFGAVVQGVSILKDIHNISIEQITLLFPVAALTLLFNYIGKLGVLSRIQQNFKITASNRERRGVAAIESPAYCREIMPRIRESQPTIAYTSRGDFFSDFLALSFSTKYDVGINRAVAPVCIVGALIVALVTRLLSGNILSASTAFATVLCICSTLSSTFVENIPLAKMSKVLLPMGAMVSGNKAVESFCDTNAIVLTENELFPKGHVYLNGIKAFPNGKIDDAILDAASVLCALDGSLGYLFLDMIGGDKKLLKKVDNVVYENNMGLSGWVDGRRVLIGNRMLMQNHGIKLPNDSYEKANPKQTPGNPIYLSNTGDVSARFLVEYTVDEELADQLDQFAAKEKELIVYTTDANIDQNKIWEIYGYPLDLITIMSSELQDGFREMSEPKEEIPAEIVYTGRPASFVAAILATINARSAILAGTIIQLIQIVFGYGLVALMAFMGYLESFSVVQMVLYQLLWFVIIFVVQQMKKP